MRIGLVSERIGAHLGGAERWTSDFAGWLVRGGHDVHVVCRADPRCAPPEGVTCHTVDCGRSPLAFASAAASRVDALRLDVSHDMGGGWNCTVFQPHCGSRAAAIQRNLRLVRPGLRSIAESAQRFLPRYRRFSELCQRQYADADRRFVAVSQMVARDMERYHGVDPGRIDVIHNGVDVDWFSPAIRNEMRAPTREFLDVSEHDVLLILVAHNLRLKGLPALMQGAAALRRRGAPVKLAVVGSRKTGRYARMCRRLGIEARFVGSVEDPRPFYAAADAYVHPTFYDPCSLVVLEAWACGLPVITSRFNGCAELMRNGLEDYIVDDPSEARDLVSRLERLMDRDTRVRLGLQSRELAETLPAEHNFLRIVNVYQESLSGRRVAA